ncbi:hypothetical protein [Leptospira sarikeiensis]|uniref:Outer membrane protein beta-barrel domain-containing protein n=1 Tax=Leptospira sarikeiensis TaxID=2484943 RepID=A0A4R9K345_9LEPT|nr:hypothetical protein [Leptospira sarikeiensis]TGL60469.1 hypothetical protein EHQ64_11550 [Leptospira sarikeiensis]
MKNLAFGILFLVGIPTFLGAEFVPPTQTPIYPAVDTGSNIGFSKNYSSFSFFGGTPISPPSGSFIDSEKDYDRALLDRILLGDIKRNIAGMPALSTYDRPMYRETGLYGIETEFGWTDYIGYGFTFQGQSVNAVRQNVQKQVHFLLNEDVTTLPKDRQVYFDVSSLAFLSAHFLPNKKFDPFIKLKAGISFPSGESVHARSRDDYNARNTEMTNGRGLVLGLGIGMNYHFNSKFFYTLEFYRQSTRIYSDQFTGRVLNTFYAQFGVGIRLAMGD